MCLFFKRNPRMFIFILICQIVVFVFDRAGNISWIEAPNTTIVHSPIIAASQQRLLLSNHPDMGRVVVIGETKSYWFPDMFAFFYQNIGLFGAKK